MAGRYQPGTAATGLLSRQGQYTTHDGQLYQISRDNGRLLLYIVSDSFGRIYLRTGGIQGLLQKENQKRKGDTRLMVTAG